MDNYITNSINLASCQLRYVSHTNQFNSYSKDIIPGQYEGGFKLWECTLDLLRYFDAQPTMFQGRRVLQMGCGHGLLGIMAKKIGASYVCLQDYNEDVIQKLTKGTVLLNCNSLQGFGFMSGDWKNLKSEQKYDIIVGSQLIYNQENYEKVIMFICEFLKQGGICILGNKHYYFGVGGNMPGFKKMIDSSCRLKCQSLSKIVPEKGGNKKQIVKITWI